MSQTRRHYSKKLAEQFGFAVIGWRLRRREIEARQKDTRDILSRVVREPELQAYDWAEEVERAAKKTSRNQLLISSGLVVALALVLTVGVAMILPGIYAWLSNRVSSSPTPTATTTAEPTYTPRPIAIWTFSGRVVNFETGGGLGGASLRLKLKNSEQQWGDVGSAKTGADGVFQLQYEGATGTGDFRIALEPPPGWNLVKSAQGPPGWEWKKEIPQELVGQFKQPGSVADIRFELAVRRTFSGQVYFEGVNAPEKARVELHYRDKDRAKWSDPLTSTVVTRPSDSPTHTVPVPFALEHVSAQPNVDCRIALASVDTQQSADWAAGVLGGMGTIEDSAIRIPGSSALDVQGIVFAGPLPIRLTWELAEFQPAYDPRNAGYDPRNPARWVNQDLSIKTLAHFPYAYRESSDTPLGIWSRWPLWLPPGNNYEIWAGQPKERNSAVVIYKLLRQSADGEEGEEVGSAQVRQCSTSTEPEKQVGDYRSDQIANGGAFWLKIDEDDATANVDCKDHEFRLPVWWIEVRRGK